MADPIVIFNFESSDITVQCSKNETMRNIIQRFGSKIQKNSNSFIYLYGGGQVNFELTFEEQANQIDKENNKMKILVYENENNEKLEKLLNSDNNSNEMKNKNIIKGIIEISTNDINKNIVLFNTEINKDIDVYIDKEKINIIKENNKRQYNFNKPGKYMFEIVFNDDITNCKNFFKKCTNIISLDFSNFNTSNIIDMEDMFSECNKLKEIKGINKIITNKVTNMSGLFNECFELEYLDLSNFNTANVTDMECMFNGCTKLKEIIGINKFITNKVTAMNGMFQQCNELEYLDLSNFNTANVTDMSFMFNKCHKLKYLNVSNFLINCETKNMFKFNKKECKLIANNQKLIQLYNSS